MKKYFFTLFAALFCLGGMNASAQAVLKAEKTTHDFGTFSEDTPVTCKITIQNTGDKPFRSRRHG